MEPLSLPNFGPKLVHVRQTGRAKLDPDLILRRQSLRQDCPEAPFTDSDTPTMDDLTTVGSTENMNSHVQLSPNITANRARAIAGFGFRHLSGKSLSQLCTRFLQIQHEFAST